MVRASEGWMARRPEGRGLGTEPRARRGHVAVSTARGQGQEEGEAGLIDPQIHLSSGQEFPSLLSHHG